MKKNYELYELNKCHYQNSTAKAADDTNSYPFATKLQNSIQNDSYNS